MSFLHYLQWRPGIGDPSFMGWLTVAAYAVAAVTAWLASHRVGGAHDSSAGSVRLWILIAMLMGALCINKQLNLLSLVTDIGRAIAREHGWYDRRHEFQKWLVAVVVAISLVIGVALSLKFRRPLKRHLLLAAGLVFLLTFIAVRAISLDSIDVSLGFTVLGVRMNWLFELTGIFLVWLAAIIELQTIVCRRQSRRP
jgi:hypothetical protein